MSSDFPLLIYGDPYISKSELLRYKEKYSNASWIEKSASKDSLDEIRMEAGFLGFGCDDKIIVVQDLPIQKATLEFLIELAYQTNQAKIIIFDSSNRIVQDPKTHKLNAKWGKFVDDFNTIKGSNVFYGGEQLTGKDELKGIGFIEKRFKENGIHINDKESKLLLDLVGSDKGLLASEIDKLSFTAPSPVTSKFLLENTFPTTSAAVLYQLGNAINDANYSLCVDTIERFIDSGINPNQIAEILLKQSRWQLVAVYYWCVDVYWNQISDKMMDMGKFPYDIWHKELPNSEKKSVAAALKTTEDYQKYLIEKKKLRIHDAFKDNKKNKKSGESIPMKFMAQQTVEFIREKIVAPNKKLYTNTELKEKIFDRCLKVYSSAHEKYVDIRCGDNQLADLYDMVKSIIDSDLTKY